MTEIPRSEFEKLPKVMIKEHEKVQFICTHNSRRSIFSQVWAWVARNYYKVNISSFSGGTEVTSVYKTVIASLRKNGLDIIDGSEQSNRRFKVEMGKDYPPITLYSKVFDAEENPTQDFIAIMTCSHADENCPFIPGAKGRFSLTYEDPKFSDNTDQDEQVYLDKSKEIGTEIFYLFSLLKNKHNE